MRGIESAEGSTNESTAVPTRSMSKEHSTIREDTLETSWREKRSIVAIRAREDRV